MLSLKKFLSTVSLRWEPTSVNLTATNGNFSGTVNATSGSFTGSIYATSGTFKGTISGSTITGGTITGTTISGTTISGSNISGGTFTGVNINGARIKLTRDRYVDVRSGDPDKIRNYITGQGTLTDEEKIRLDLNNDGEVNSVDYVIAQNILNGSINNHFIDEILINYDKSEILCGTKHSSGQLTEQWETQIKDGGIVTGTIVAGKRYSNHDASIGFNGDWIISSGCGFLVGGAGSNGMNVLQLYTGSGSYNTNGYVLNSNLGYIAIGQGDDLVESHGSRIYFEPKPHGTYDMVVRPRTNGKTTLGDTEHRYYNVYLTHSPNISSDRRMKEDFKEFDERYINLFEKLKPQIYKLISAPNDKSKMAGFIAQDIESAMVECGIDKKEFGIYKHDIKSDSYAIIYDMFIPLIVYYVQNAEKKYERNLSIVNSENDYLKYQLEILNDKLEAVMRGDYEHNNYSI